MEQKKTSQLAGWVLSDPQYFRDFFPIEFRYAVSSGPCLMDQLKRFAGPVEIIHDTSSPGILFCCVLQRITSGLQASKNGKYSFESRLKISSNGKVITDTPFKARFAPNHFLLGYEGLQITDGELDIAFMSGRTPLFSVKLNVANGHPTGSRVDVVPVDRIQTVRIVDRDERGLIKKITEEHLAAR